MNRPHSRPSGRQKRPRVPESLRKRAARACVACRYHKEKCQGGMPCARCQQYKRVCRFDTVATRDQQPLTSTNINTSSSDNARAEQWSERERQMERIVRHFMGEEVSMDTRTLEELADTLEDSRSDADAPVPENLEGDQTISESYSLEPLSTIPMHYSGELSHWNFSKIIHHQLQILGSSRELDDIYIHISHVADNF